MSGHKRGKCKIEISKPVLSVVIISVPKNKRDRTKICWKNWRDIACQSSQHDEFTACSCVNSDDYGQLWSTVSVTRCGSRVLDMSLEEMASFQLVGGVQWSVGNESQIEITSGNTETSFLAHLYVFHFVIAVTRPVAILWRFFCFFLEAKTVVLWKKNICCCFCDRNNWFSFNPWQVSEWEHSGSGFLRKGTSGHGESYVDFCLLKPLKNICSPTSWNLASDKFSVQKSVAHQGDKFVTSEQSHLRLKEPFALAAAITVCIGIMTLTQARN